jgi:hypothetical protein
MGTKEIRVTTRGDTEDVKLPKLVMSIFKDDVLVRTVEIDDPRELLIHTFNRDNRDLGLIAEPA